MHNPINKQIPNLHIQAHNPLRISHPHIPLTHSPLPIMDNHRLPPPPPRIPFILRLLILLPQRTPTLVGRPHLDIIPLHSRLNAAVSIAQPALAKHTIIP